jgi:hypothetical protein
MFRRTKNQHAAVPCAQVLEPRRLFSTYIVTGLGDSAGSVSSIGNDHFNATTLRAAISATNAHSGSDFIRFSSSLNGAITLNTALPAISDNLSIAGPGASIITVQRKSTASTGFSIFRVNPSKTVTIRGLTIARGTGSIFTDSFGGTHRVGGGIFNRGTLSLIACTVSANKTYNEEGDGGGGGIYNTGSLTLTSCTLSGNIADSNVGFSDGDIFFGTDGGGIYNDHGNVKVLLSTLSSNSATEEGGGIFNSSGGTLLVSGSTLKANNAYVGGAIATGGTLTLTNSTLVSNTAAFGGAIGNGGTLTATNCTIFGNTVGGSGGGISNGGSLTLYNSIVAGNRFDDGSTTHASDIGGNANSASSFNLIGAGGAGGLQTGVNGNKVNVSVSSLKLGSLANNGGKTATMKLNAGSIAIDAGSNARASAAGLSADQRGFPRIENGRVDIGAFETQAAVGSIAGIFFNDVNRDGIRQSTEPHLSDMQVYIDANHNATYDPGEQTTFTDSTGAYKFTGLTAGTYRVRGVQPPGWVRTRPAGIYPAGYYDVTINLTVNGGAVTGKDFGSYLT